MTFSKQTSLFSHFFLFDSSVFRQPQHGIHTSDTHREEPKLGNRRQTGREGEISAREMMWGRKKQPKNKEFF